MRSLISPPALHPNSKWFWKCHRILNTQNSRGWRASLEIIESNPLLKLVPYSRSGKHPDGCWWSEKKTPQPGMPFLMLLHSDSKYVFLHVCVEIPVFQFVPVTPRPVTGHHWKEPGPIHLTSTLQISIGIGKIPSQSSLGWTVTGLSAFPQKGDAPGSPSSLWPFVGLSLSFLNWGV